jgi:branched-chain amino acid transport system substrate-binding protein
MRLHLRRLLLLTTVVALPALLAACNTRPSVSAGPPAISPGPSPMTASGKVKIALLLPLSGRAATLGQAMQEASELALFDGAGRSIAISTYDTGDTPEGAVDAFNRAKAEGTALVLGPLFGASTSRLQPLTREANINMISFSNDEQVAQSGSWIMGLAAGPQVRRITDFAVGRGIRSFAILAPQSPYGQQTSRVLEEQVTARRGSVVAREYFDPNATDVSEPVRRVAGSLPTGDGTAIFLPVSGRALPMVVATLATNQVDPSRVKYLGTGVWDESAAWQISGMNGAWFAAPDPAARAEFDRRFTATYGKPAPRLATLAYDAVRFAGNLATVRPGGDFSAAAITNPAGMAGADGPFRFLPDGRVERSLAVMEVSGNRITVVGPASTGFDRPAF